MSLDELKAGLSNGVKTVAIKPECLSRLEICAYILGTAVSSNEIANEEDIIFLTQSLLAEILKTYGQIKQIEENSKSIMITTKLVCDLYTKTGVNNMDSIRSILPALLAIEKINYPEWCVEFQGDLNKIFKDEHSKKLICDDEFIKKHHLSLITELITVICPLFDDYLNIKIQLLTTINLIVQGAEYLSSQVINDIENEHINLAFATSKNMYVETCKQYLNKNNTSKLSAGCLKKIRKDYEVHLGLLALAYKHTEPSFKKEKA
ncbi:MAG: hypothetical protein HAW67_06980 [Endozoicomonadaceae bacterium]|nr:hypothetical protein [Endozoicomonadaceae bacterium]